jgi:hypothetical protein
MSSNYYQERRSYIAFLFFLVITALVITLSPHETLHYGLLSVFWGLFGFLRLAYLLENKFQNFSSILHLPTQILFGITNEENDMRGFVMRRLERLDIIYWFGIALCFIIWALYCSFDPTNIGGLKVEKFYSINSEMLSPPKASTLFLVMMAMVQYSLIGIILFLALTYSHSRLAVAWALKSIIPLFFILLGLSFLLIPMAQPIHFDWFTSIKGGGIGVDNMMSDTAPEMMQEHGTGLFRRYMNLGIIGAFGVYLAFVPACYLLLRNLFDSKRGIIRPLVGVVILLVLLTVDVFFIAAAPFLNALMLLGFASLGLCWGAALSPR